MSFDDFGWGHDPDGEMLTSEIRLTGKNYPSSTNPVYDNWKDDDSVDNDAEDLPVQSFAMTPRRVNEPYSQIFPVNQTSYEDDDDEVIGYESLNRSEVSSKDKDELIPVTRLRKKAFRYQSH